jgi:two-component system response regulator PilR (NtrC family)
MGAAKKILGEAPVVKELLDMIRRVAPSRTNVLIIGESGTGKELVARLIHDSSQLKDKPFVPVNCGAIPENLIESELFGHKKGSFTGAVSDKPGLFEVASNGTIFLDEVGELPLGMQVKLLRAIQERTIRRVGGTDSIRVDARIIAATNKDLETAVRNGTFREDLYYRLNVILIRTPPLRDRRGDVRLLADAFLEKFSKKAGKKLAGFDSAASRALDAYPWPGNVRELENTIERAVTLEPGDKITLEVLPPAVSATGPQLRAVPSQPGQHGKKTTGKAVSAADELRIPLPDFSAGSIDLDRILGDVERAFLLKALSHSGGVKKKAADLLGVTFRSMRYRLKKLGLDAGADGEGEDAGEE